MYENDFVDENKEVETDIDGRKFAFRPITGGTESKWFKKYMKVEQETGEIICDHEILTSLKLGRITKVPYGKDIIQNQIGVDKEFEELNESQKITFLNKLGKNIHKQLVKAFDNYQEGDTEQKKK